MAAKKNVEATKKTASKRTTSSTTAAKSNGPKGGTSNASTNQAKGAAKSSPKASPARAAAAAAPAKKKAAKRLAANEEKPPEARKKAKLEPERAVSTAPKSRAKTAPRKLQATAKDEPAPPKTRAANSKAAAPNALGDGRVLTVGDTVPAFEAVDQDGELVKSSSLAGSPYVLYFYPKDDTPGCTTEACGFRDEHAQFTQRGIRILGVSPDSPASHARFRQKYGLGFTLLADTERKLVTQFGVWKLKQNYGREYWGVERSTFIVDAHGKIAKAWRGVKVAGHIPAVLEAASKL